MEIEDKESTIDNNVCVDGGNYDSSKKIGLIIPRPSVV